MIPAEDPQRATSFSCPQSDPQGRLRLLTDVLASQAKALTGGLLRRFGPTIQSKSEGFTDVLDKLAHSNLALRESVAYPIPQFRSSFGAWDFDPTWAASSAALYLDALGWQEEWSATLRQPRRMVHGLRVSPEVSGLAVSGGSVEWTPPSSVETSGNGDWDELVRIPTSSQGISILDGEVIDLVPFTNRTPWCECSAAQVAENLSEALAILRDYAPTYSAWVEDVLRFVVPIAPVAPDTSHSRTNPAVPAVVFMSFPADPVRSAEILVHECSHLYYHLVREWFRTSNGRDPRLYYSPYVGRDRPIERILVAFHAFANVALFYRACQESGAPFPDVCARRIDQDVPRLTTLRAHLEATDGLTRVGRGVWQPLAEQLFA